jgi:hypothetical protein
MLFVLYTLGRPRRLEDNVNVNLKGIACDDGKCTDVVYDCVQWGPFLLVVLNLRIIRVIRDCLLFNRLLQYWPNNLSSLPVPQNRLCKLIFLI